MELNKKQLELVENIFKNYNHCELGQALEQYESDYIMEMNEDTKRFFDKLKSEYNAKLAFEFDTICGNSQEQAIMTALSKALFMQWLWQTKCKYPAVNIIGVSVKGLLSFIFPKRYTQHKAVQSVSLLDTLRCPLQAVLSRSHIL